jgi:hypothetical protein
MKLFDFKFLILLALALVVYFIYKELENQREKILYCEEKIKQILDNKNEEKPLELPNKIINNIKPPQIIQQQPINALKLQLPSKTFIKPIKNDEESVEESSSSNTSNNLNRNKTSDMKYSENKIVEIYSNDNENNLETTISDTLIQNKKIDSVNLSDKKNDQQLIEVSNEESDTVNGENEEKEESPEENEVNGKNEDNEESTEEKDESNNQQKIENLLKNTSDTITEEPDENTSDTNTEELDENTSENNSIDLESIKRKMMEHKKFLNDTSEDSEDFEENKSESTLELEKVLEDLRGEISEDKKKYDLKELNGMKIKDLQNLIKTENLCLDKKINGVSKKKNKQELIEELCKI